MIEEIRWCDKMSQVPVSCKQQGYNKDPIQLWSRTHIDSLFEDIEILILDLKILIHLILDFKILIHDFILLILDFKIIIVDFKKMIIDFKIFIHTIDSLFQDIKKLILDLKILILDFKILIPDSKIIYQIKRWNKHEEIYWFVAFLSRFALAQNRMRVVSVFLRCCLPGDYSDNNFLPTLVHIRRQFKYF